MQLPTSLSDRLLAATPLPHRTASPTAQAASTYPCTRQTDAHIEPADRETFSFAFVARKLY